MAIGGLLVGEAQELLKMIALLCKCSEEKVERGYCGRSLVLSLMELLERGLLMENEKSLAGRREE